MKLYIKALLLVLAVTAWTAPAQDNLHILQPNNIDRLRMDFNASRSKVRLVFMLSPT